MKKFKRMRRITFFLTIVLLAEQIILTWEPVFAYAAGKREIEYTIEHKVTSSWDGGYTAEIVLINQNDYDSEGWTVIFNTTDEITNLWGGEITDRQELYFQREEDEQNEYLKEESAEKIDRVDMSEAGEDSISQNDGDEAEFEEINAVDTESEENNSDGVYDEIVENKVQESEDVNEVLDNILIEEESVSENNDESQEEKYETPLTPNNEKCYYRYTVKALDHNAVITAGGAVTIGYSAIGEDHDIWNESAVLILRQEKANRVVPIGGFYEYDGVTIEVIIPDYWDSSYNVKMIINNTGTETIHNWALMMKTDDSISGLYNAVDLVDSDGKRVIKNAGYNQDIPVGESIELGYTARYDVEPDVPKTFAVSGFEKYVDSDVCEVSMFITNEWNDGGCAQIIITNNSDEPIEDWMLSFDSDLDIIDAWGGVIEGRSEGKYYIRNAGYSQNILPGESVTVGFLFSGESADIKDVEVKHIVTESDLQAEEILSVSKEQMQLNERGNYELAEEFSRFSGTLERADEVTDFSMKVYDKHELLIYEAKVVPETEWTNDDFAFIYGQNRFVFEVNFGSECYSTEMTLDCKSNYNFDKLNIDLEDTDGDGLVNYLESYFETEENNIDTDSDGLNDYQELYNLGYDPLKPDTDDDGILDRDEDADGDGISNLQEYELGASPVYLDSDHDRLLDSQELEFGTSLILEDSDNDGATDYEEYVLDQSGAVYNAAGNTYTAVYSADEMKILYDRTVIPSVNLTGDAKALMDFSIEMVEGNYLLNPSMVGFLGQAYVFSTDGNVIDAELKFTYDESLINEDTLTSEKFYPTIYSFDQDEDTLTEVDNQVWEGNTVTAHLDHFSTYLLANKAELESFWNRSDDVYLTETEYVTPNSDLLLQDKGKLIIYVKDQEGNPVPDTDVLIYHTFYAYRNAMGGLFGEAVDPDTFFMKTKTNKSGVAECYLDPEDADYNGCYTVVADKGNENGGMATVGSYNSTQGLFSNGIEAGKERKLDIVVTPYALDHENKGASFQVRGGSTQGPILYSCKVKLFEGWGITDFSEPTYEVHQEAGGWGKEFFGMNVPMGRYTVLVGREGYPSFKTEILITQKNKYFLFVLGGNNNVVENELENNLDRNNDGLDDELERLICQGQVTTLTGTTVFTGMRDNPEWEKTYELVMQSSDRDEDGLKNGDEIKIYYMNGMPYIKIISNPEIKDSDFDGIFDNDEVLTYLTDPLEPNVFIDNKDYLYISNYNNFESGKAYDAYLDRSFLAIAAEYDFNAIILGGEANMIKSAEFELIDLFTCYAEQQTEEIEGKGLIYATDCVLRGTVDLLPRISDIERTMRIEEINNCQFLKSLLENAKKTRNYKLAGYETRTDLKIALRELTDHITELEGNIDNTHLSKSKDWMTKYGNSGAWIIAFAGASAETIEDLEQYSAGLVLVNNYEAILLDLMTYGDAYISDASAQIYRNLYDEGARNWTSIRMGIENYLGTGITTIVGTSILDVAKLSDVILDLIWLSADLVIGDTIQNNITNYTSVECANAITLATNHYISSSNRLVDNENNIVINFSAENDNIANLIDFECFARRWTEVKYTEYLDTNRAFGDNVWFIYDTQQSSENAKDNINKLSEMIERY